MNNHRYRAGAAAVVLSILGCGAALAACDESSSQDTSVGADGATSATSSGSGGGGAGGADAGADCADGSHDDGTGACVTTLSAWTTGPLLAKGRDHHVTFVATT